MADEEATTDSGDEAAPVESDPAGEFTADEALLKTLDDLDYSKYQKPELRASIESILSVVATLKFFIGVFFLTFPTCFSLIIWLFSDRGWLTIFAAACGSLVVSFIVAMLLAATLATRRILNEMVSVIDLTLEIVGEVISDVGTTRDRGIVATAALVFGGVSRNLVLPIVESVVSSQLGCIGWPVLWVYRRTFAKMVDYGTNRLLHGAHKLTAPVSQHAQGAADQFGDRLKGGAEIADWMLKNVRPYVVGGSRTLSVVVLLPLWLVLAFTLIAFAGLIYVGLWLTPVAATTATALLF